MTVVLVWFDTLTNYIGRKYEKRLRAFLDKILSSIVWATEVDASEASEGVK